VTPGLFPKVGVSKEHAATVGFAMLYEPRRLFDIPLNEAGLFTVVPRWRHFFETDPLTLRRCTASFYLASRRMDKMIARLAGTKPVPMHLFLVGNDGIIDNDKTAGFIRGLDCPHCRISTYPHAYHSLEFESDPEPYFNDLVCFIDEVSRGS
jgi:alpha-beta hydrolase superfamily lysophospholipase